MSQANYNKFVKKLHEELTIARTTKKGGPGEPQTRRQLLDARETAFSIERQFISEVVMRQAPLLKKRWPDVDLQDVIESTQLMLRDAITANLKGNTKWFDEKQEIVIAKNFRGIQDLMTNVRKTLRQNARDTIERNARKLVQEESVQSAFVITGIDVRDSSQGGDLVKEDLREGVIVASANKLRNLAQQEEQGILKGIEIGHTFGPGLANLAAITRTEIIDLFSPDIQAKLIKYANEQIDLDSSHDEDVRIFGAVNGIEGKLTVTVVESADKNNKTSVFKATTFLDQVEENLDKVISIKEWEKIKGSPSIREKVFLGIGDILEDGKPRKSATKSNRKGKASSKKNIRVAIYGPKISTSKSKKTRTPKSKAKAATFGNLRGEINLINSRLKEQIRENMGKGSSKTILNYRTGRFAKSAEVKDIYLPKGSKIPEAKVKYMRYPYGVFEPGGRLHKPGRDPHRIFGRSIRQILQEEAIGNFKRVRVKISG